MKANKYIAALFLVFISHHTMAQAILFQDDFSDPALSAEWESIRPSQWVQSGWMHSLDTGPGRDSFAVVHDGDTSWTDYTYTLQADGLLSMGGQVENANILFRTEDVNPGPTCCGLGGKYYRLEIMGPMGVLNKLELGRHKNDKYTILFVRQNFPTVSTPLQVKVTVQGARIQVWINGDKIIDLVDSDPLLYGGVGVGAVWETEARFDDLVVTAEDARREYIDLTQLPDINGNSFPETAALRRLANGHPQVVIKDSNTGKAINFVGFFGPGWEPKGVDTVDANGDNMPDLAVLAVRETDGRIKVQVRDAKTDAFIKQIDFFGPNWEARNLTVDDADYNGMPDISVLAVNKTNGNVAVEIRDATTGAKIKRIWFPK